MRVFHSFSLDNSITTTNEQQGARPLVSNAIDVEESEKTSPIVVYEVEDNLKNSTKLLNSYFTENNLQQHIQFFLTDRHKNLLIFANSTQDAESLEMSKSL